jgi:hypothetical protein
MHNFLAHKSTEVHDKQLIINWKQRSSTHSFITEEIQITMVIRAIVSALLCMLAI